MKAIFFFLLVLFTSFVWGQTLHSTHTIHVPQEIYEDIQRTITISREYVHIKSLVDNINVNNQVWKIYKHWKDEETIMYHLISLDESHSIQMHIRKEKPQYIEVHQPTKDNDIQTLHLYLELYQ